MEYTADLRDIKFQLFDVLDAGSLQKLAKYADYGADDYEAIMEAAYAFAAEVLAPINDSGDKEGVSIAADGKITMPAGFKEAWKQYTAGGWTSATQDQDCGGQGLPVIVGQVIHEFFTGANVSFTLCGGLTEGVADLIIKFGNDELKAMFLSGLFEQGWAGTMDLTEDCAGSDVGAARTVARPQANGTYLIEGTKIFITGGDQDMSDNLVHAVLARVEGDPAGTKGLSLFIVPKYRVTADGKMTNPPVWNDVKAPRIEHKLGIKASPTCVMNFGENGACEGYLLGERAAGMVQMFHMMNEARILVGTQSLGLAGIAYEKSREYARERLQGSDLEHMKDPNAPRVAIINHPDVRRMLLWQKSVVEALRGLLYMTAMFEDQSRAGATPEEREKAHGYVELLTPVCKAWCSDMGYRSVDLGVQTLGGFGFTNEYPLEQFLRDSRIGSIYEGTNGIQAMDFVARKIPMKGMKVFSMFVKEIMAFAAANASHPALGDLCGKLRIATNSMTEAAMKLLSVGMQDPSYLLLYAGAMLDTFGDVVGSWMLLRQAVVASAKLDAMYAENNCVMDSEKAKLLKDNPDAAFYFGKLKSAEFFTRNILPFASARVEIIKGGDKSPIEVVL
jgi:alkylation response protein AidB-like acyl-CoA dehydrogenase